MKRAVCHSIPALMFLPHCVITPEGRHWTVARFLSSLAAFICIPFIQSESELVRIISPSSKNLPFVNWGEASVCPLKVVPIHIVRRLPTSCLSLANFLIKEMVVFFSPFAFSPFFGVSGCTQSIFSHNQTYCKDELLLLKSTFVQILQLVEQENRRH